jgi:hypothetical protein
VKRVLCVLVVACVVTACTSPEARRTRGGGPGADVGNRPAGTAAVAMHGGSDPFWKTPDRLDGVKSMPLDPARQAQQLSQ